MYIAVGISWYFPIGSLHKWISVLFGNFSPFLVLASTQHSLYVLEKHTLHLLEFTLDWKRPNPDWNYPKIPYYFYQLQMLPSYKKISIRNTIRWQILLTFVLLFTELITNMTRQLAQKKKSLLFLAFSYTLSFGQYSGSDVSFTFTDAVRNPAGWWWFMQVLSAFRCYQTSLARFLPVFPLESGSLTPLESFSLLSGSFLAS